MFPWTSSKGVCEESQQKTPFFAPKYEIVIFGQAGSWGIFQKRRVCWQLNRTRGPCFVQGHSCSLHLHLVGRELHSYGTVSRSSSVPSLYFARGECVCPERECLFGVPEFLGEYVLSDLGKQICVQRAQNKSENTASNKEWEKMRNPLDWSLTFAHWLPSAGEANQLRSAPNRGMVRGRGCNDSFRAAVDRSYDGPNHDAETMETGAFAFTFPSAFPKTLYSASFFLADKCDAFDLLFKAPPKKVKLNKINEQK